MVVILSLVNKVKRLWENNVKKRLDKALIKRVKFRYKSGKLNKLLQDISPNYQILNENTTEDKALKNLCMARRLYTHPLFDILLGTQVFPMQNNYIVEPINHWISYGGEFPAAQPGQRIAHVATPGVTRGVFTQNIEDASKDLKRYLGRRAPVNRGLDNILAEIKNARYDKGHGKILYRQLTPEVRNLIPNLRQAERIGAGDDYIPARQEEFLNRITCAVGVLDNYVSDLVQNNIGGGGDLAFLVNDFTSAPYLIGPQNQQRNAHIERFNISNIKKDTLKNGIIVSSLGRRNLRKAVYIREQRSAKIMEILIRHLITDQDTSDEKLEMIKENLDNAVAGNINAANIANDTYNAVFNANEINDVEAHLQDEGDSEDHVRHLMKKYVVNERKMRELNKYLKRGEGKQRDLLHRIKSKVLDEAAMRRGFNRYPVNQPGQPAQYMNFPTTGQIMREFNTYINWVYNGSDTPQPITLVDESRDVQRAKDYVLNKIHKKGNIFSVFKKKKDIARDNLIMDMFSHYKTVHNWGAQQNDQTSPEKYLKELNKIKNPITKDMKIEEMYDRVCHSHAAIAAHPDPNVRDNLTKWSKAFIGLYKINKALERM